MIHFFDNYPYKIILASGSPRRHQFFKDLHLPFEVRLHPVEELYPPELKREEIALYLAELKASAFNDLQENELLITSDTVVWCEGESLAKAADAAEARKMLQKISGKTHEVITGVCFKTRNKTEVFSDTTLVTFKSLTNSEIDFYISEYKPFDKAGAYGIQEWIGLMGVERIEGSYFNVMGLPTHLVYRVLKKFAT